jgi:hypothetical protein
VFSSAKWFGRELWEFASIFVPRNGFRVFLFRGTSGIPSEITICSVYSVFRGIIFLWEIPNPTAEAVFSHLPVLNQLDIKHTTAKQSAIPPLKFHVTSKDKGQQRDNCLLKFVHLIGLKRN